MNVFDEARNVLQLEIDTLCDMQNNILPVFGDIVDEISECQGKVILTGMGKSGHIAKKISATMASIGICSTFMHPGEALHGDLGIVCKGDIVIALSFSGETEEVLSIIPSLNKIGVDIIAIVGKENSSLEYFAKYTYCIPRLKEVFLDDVPTSSTTAMLALGDAIAVTVAKKRHFGRKDFALLHPHGTLGKKMTLTVADVMKSDEEIAVCKRDSSVNDAILQMCAKPVGCVCIIDEAGRLLGIFTDGDLRRLINNHKMNLSQSIDCVMTVEPYIISPNELVVDEIKKIEKKGVSYSVYPVVENNRLLGVLCVNDVLKLGII